MTTSKTAPAIVLRNPKDLHEHPLLKNQPKWADNDPRFLALCDSVREQGVIEAIKVTADDAIVDGRHRWRAAKKMQVDVPTLVVAEEDAAGIILGSLLNRRHYTPGQRAFVLAGVIQEAFTEAQNRMLAGKKKNPANSVRRVKTPDEWAAEIGVSPRYLQQARELHELFKDTEKRSLTDRDGLLGEEVTFREFFEPRIMADEEPYGLGAALTGIKTHLALNAAAAKGRAHTGGKPKAVEKQLDLFDDAIKDSIKRFKYFEKFDDDTRAKHFQTIRAKADGLPAEQCESIAAYHQRVAREFTAAAKAAKKD